jgi:radical SAM-linked protein
MVRVLPRVLRRAGLPLYYSEGYSPRPVIAFGPALALGMTSLAEYADFALTEEVAIDGLLEGLTQSTEPGLTFFGVRRLAEEEPSLSKLIGAQDFLAILPVDEAGGVAAEKTLRSYQIRCQEILALHQVPVTVLRKGKTRTVDLKSVVIEAQVDWTDSLAPVAPPPPLMPLMEVAPGRPAALLRLRVGSGASLRPAEITGELFGLALRPIDFLRLHCWHLTPDGALRDPLDSGLPKNIRRAHRPPAP